MGYRGVRDPLRKSKRTCCANPSAAGQLMSTGDIQRRCRPGLPGKDGRELRGGARRQANRTGGGRRWIPYCPFVWLRGPRTISSTGVRSNHVWIRQRRSCRMDFARFDSCRTQTSAHWRSLASSPLMYMRDGGSWAPFPRLPVPLLAAFPLPQGTYLVAAFHGG